MTDIADIPINSLVSWSGTRFGLAPVLSEQATQILEQGQSRVPDLVNALNDPERFITAHVLLSKITGARFENQDTWNGLQIDIQADGNTRFDAGQRQDLAKRWRHYLQTQASSTDLSHNQ